MIDSEVARLRRLRSEALKVRAIARTLQSTPWAANESLVDRSACLGWRIARVVSGRLRGHPYAEYQKDEAFTSRMAHRLHAAWVVLGNSNRGAGLKVLAAHVTSLARRLDDAVAVTWSSEFSEALVRAQSELKVLGRALVPEAASERAQETPALRADLGAALEGDWPYLAF